MQPSSPALRLQVPDEIAAGTLVPITLHVANTGPHPLDLYLRGRTIAFDVEIATPDGTVVWRRLDGAVLPAILRLRTLAPGESFTLQAGWDQRARDGAPVAPGRYVARGRLLTDAEPLETPPTELVVRA